MLISSFPPLQRKIALLTVTLAIVMTSAGCSRRFSVSLNEQILYDPRPGNVSVTVRDAGLQSCINVLMRERGLTDPAQVQVLACPGLEIASLAGIGQLTNLRFLDVAGNQLTTLDGLGSLGNLSSVNAPDNRLQDISAINDLATLSSAVLTGNQQIPCSQLNELGARLGNNLLGPASCAP